MAALLGLAASLAYGTADFLGGLAARRVRPIAAVLVSQVVGLASILVVLPAFLGAPFALASGVWAGISGVIGATGIALLYRALAIGRMSVVAPTSAVVGATVPVVAGMFTGEAPSGPQLVGVLIALVAVALVSSVPERSPRTGAHPHLPRRGLAEALGAGVAFGIFFLTFNEAGDLGGGMWPLVTARVVSVTVLAVAALSLRVPLRVEPGVRVPLVTAGVLDTAANVFFLLGSRRGLLPVVAVLTSLYPATTVLLARTVLRERMTPLQVAGLGAALLGIVLITAG